MYRTLISICLVGIFACGSEEDKTPGPEDPRPPSQDGGFLFDVGIRERDTQAPRRDTQVVPDREIQPPDPDQGRPPPRPDIDRQIQLIHDLLQQPYVPITSVSRCAEHTRDIDLSCLYPLLGEASFCAYQ